MRFPRALHGIAVSVGTLLFTLCSEGPQGPSKSDWSCFIGSTTPDYVHRLGCKADFDALASAPMDASIPGATSVKTVIDREDPYQVNPLYIQNSKKYPVHYDFASAHLSGGDYPPVIQSTFTNKEYYRKDRRFILGAVTYYAGPGVWVYEISPYDNAGADMIELAYKKIVDSTTFGDSIYFHPTSVAVEDEAKNLPASVRIMTTDELYKGIDYQPLNLATSIGRLVFVKAAQLDSEYISFRDIVVLDAVPNDISITMGIITQAFQTPLAHINVLSNNRGTPNMALRGAWDNKELRAFENKWVKLTVGPFEHMIAEVTAEEADAWWEANKPATVSIAAMDTATREIRDVRDVLQLTRAMKPDAATIGAAIRKAIPAYGGKASHFSCFPLMDSVKVPYPDAFAVPVFYYWQFMEQNGLNAMVDRMLQDSAFKNNPSVRDARLASLRDSMMNAPLDPAFEVALFAKLKAEFPQTAFRFRSSTNAEDLDGFTGAGLYTSNGATLDKPNSVRNAVRTVWSSVWFFRAFEERTYRNIDHKSVGMALLTHRSFTSEEGTGVAITANIFDLQGLEPGFYINVQYGDESVVLPDSNVTTDEFIYHFDMPGQPIVFIGRSNLLPVGKATVLTTEQVYTLGEALQVIHAFFKPIYGSTASKKYAMDTEFKFDQPPDDPNGAPVLYMKQCRPYY